MQHAALVSSRLPACSPNLRSLTRDEDDRAPLPWGLPVLVLVLVLHVWSGTVYGVSATTAAVLPVPGGHECVKSVST